ncbi:LsmAD domain-containing protein [Penicillium ucsense]|uniref:LsmAD domain-containing protein n=1 Tax=Penicillium ucsense TaxID=2839758 RepID=A0A8J8W740_9EURO|nr:LsmAD domain-containing protein [Penicillium ucsense]KAF7735711.1 LsmAD domain-containing protein [Penicillium ucsense]
MASTLNSVPATNSTSGNNANNASQTSTRPSLRSSGNTKGDGRRQSGSPVDGGQRRTNSHRAWTQGTNPITQRPSYASSNGTATRQTGSPRPGQKESNTPDSHAHDRLLFLFASFIGLNATITTKSGDKFAGIFSSSHLEASSSSFVLKMAHRLSENSNKSNGVHDASVFFVGAAPEHSMAFDVKDVVDISVPKVVPAEVSIALGSSTGGFRTDADISGNLAMRERTLKRWEPSEHDVDMSLESTTGDSKNWDQFETNERLFGAKTSYDENIYTTRIDRSDPNFRQRQAEAARIAAEIEGTDVDNVHMREERGLAVPDTGDQDEEDKYSGVQRENKVFPPLVSGQPNKYMPPGRRQAAAQPALPVKSSASNSPAPALQSPEPAQEASSAENPQLAATPKEPTEPEQKPDSSSLAPAAPVPPPAKQQRPAAENATANVETEVLDHFRQFANSEKLKMQERRRNQASYDRTVKLNELMKFSKNFKLNTPVPKDLVPILAKDPHKQEAIISRAKNSEDSPSPQPPAQVVEQKPALRATGPTGAMPPTAPADRHNYPRGRQGYPPTGPLGSGGNPRYSQQALQSNRPPTGMLSHRLADNLQQRKGAALGAVPAPLPVQDARVPPTGPASEQARVTSPPKSQSSVMANAASKFNVRAMEFKPNPAASTFTPGGPTTPAPAAATSAVSVASPSRNPSVSRAATPSSFFGARKPQNVSERPSIDDDFNPIKRMKKESAASGEGRGSSSHRGIPPPYRTGPTWDVPAGNEDKDFEAMFKQPTGVSSVPSQGRSISNNPSLPQQHQMPFHFPPANAGGPPSSGPPNGPHVHPGAHGPGHHLEDHHRMQLSASSSQVFPSPRMGQSHVGYPSPMAPHAQLAYGQPMPQFYGGPQPGHLRHYQNGPQFSGPQTGMGAPMMVQNPSSGPYMGMPQGMSPYNPQMQMYSPSPSHAYPHVPPPQSHSGYPSPSRGAPMMMHQNSQSGQPPQPMMFMSPGQPGQPGFGNQPTHHMSNGRGAYPQQQPQFSSSPHQGHHFPPNHRNTANNFNQASQIPHQAPSAHSPANAGTTPHTAEPADDSK